jgi:hypothetical protein
MAQGDPGNAPVAASAGIDGENPVDHDELDLILIGPLPSYVWYRTWSTSPTASATL